MNDQSTHAASLLNPTMISTREPVTCHYFTEHTCRSCALLDIPYSVQLEHKSERVKHELASVIGDDVWLPPVASAETGFRNKVKLAVGGEVTAPTLGLTDQQGHGVDLRECRIQSPAIWEVIPDLAGFISFAGLQPYNVVRQVGELKYILVTSNVRGQLMVRFVLRSREKLPDLERALPALRQRLPQIAVVSANFLPQHTARFEGDEEIALTEAQHLEMAIGDLTLHLGQRSFFQTNTDVAAELYDQARTWADLHDVDSVLDLYCGVGGFALATAKPGRRVQGLEREPSAVECARMAVGPADDLTFNIADADGVSGSVLDADFVIVNPPRRGIGTDLAGALNSAHGRFVMYSSCNPATLLTDIQQMPRLRPISARLFDMFPHTNHAEVAVLLKREEGEGVTPSVSSP